ncbi:flagellar basal-body rod protein FlgF [Carboxydothermus ferrireducens]|uniref:Flagellar hook protein FlgE n=1 Tax=Carboxydothermus ferrireducens DSM 11255 TaxID=1119529 RepID=A0ABX2R7K0_9THEO|nr:flagellar basal-body rod protein FlgF [Carboxydothermus ferrireducens]NYE56904.1 flagellar hook protein FlgE [Carboxydothermus ferrireducens DSM 11255]
MIRSLYAGISGLKSHQYKMDVVANNISNVNTIGYKSSRVNFEDLIYQKTNQSGVYPSYVGLGVNVSGVDTIFTQGGLKSTGRPLDVAIQGNGFFVLKDPVTTRTYYSREGVFYLDKDGYLINGHGYRVQDVNGADIQINNPEAVVTLTIQNDGQIKLVRSDGTTEFAGPIGLMSFKNPETLERIGQNVYSATIDTQTSFSSPVTPGQQGQGILVSGYLEMSNVDLASEFTEMIVTQRGYQANARVITTSDQMLEELLNIKR